MRITSLLLLAPLWMLTSASIGAVQVEPTDSPGAFPIVRGGRAATIFLDRQDWPGAIRAANDPGDDVHKVSGTLATAAESTSRNVEGSRARWEKIPDYGRGVSGMEVFPVTAASVTPPKAPCLEYEILFPKAGDVQADLITGPTLDFFPGRGLRVAVSFDDQQPQVFDAFARQGYADLSKHADTSSLAIRDRGKWVTDNARTLKSAHNVSEPGVHTLKVWMVDPAVVLETLIVRQENLRPSYFGPPEPVREKY